MARHCPQRSVMGILGADGAFAELVAVPVANLHRVPDGVDDAHAVFAEPLAAAFEILEQIDVEPGWECLVLGDGKLGLLVAQVLHQAGANVQAIGHHEAKLAMLRQRGIPTQLATEWQGSQADLVVDATGSAAGFQAAMGATRPRGTLVLKTTVAEQRQIDLAPLVINEIRVVGSRCGPFPPALEALAEGRVDVAPMVDATFDLVSAEEALAHAAIGGALKTLIDCSL
jgi:threonine dehydrogenase-like Zn-dependent dehydrogenase